MKRFFKDARDLQEGDRVIFGDAVVTHVGSSNVEGSVTVYIHYTVTDLRKHYTIPEFQRFAVYTDEVD